MKRKTLISILIGIVVLTLLGPYIAIEIRSHINKDILTNLKGEIYYTKRDHGILTLYKSDASLKNEKLIYSHKDKGLTGLGDYNDNIFDFYYDKATGQIDFIAMNDGEFSIFSMCEGEEPNLIGKSEEPLTSLNYLDKTDYISREEGGMSVILRKGSIYILENGKERCVKRFYGLYDDKFTGYGFIGFSPDGKHLVYSSMEHLTPLGSIVHNIINDFISNVYVMDLDTGKSSKFIKSWNIQWVMD